jgi:hypothetical protein
MSKLAREGVGRASTPLSATGAQQGPGTGQAAPDLVVQGEEDKAIEEDVTLLEW